MPTNTKKHLRRLTLAAILCALVFVATRFTQIPIVGSEGYIHLGDAFIYLAASILPTPYACAVGAIGAGFADITSFPIFAPGTIILKTLITLFFTSKPEKLLCKRNIVAAVPAGAVTVVGYYLYEAVFIANNFASPLASIPFNIIQAVSSAAVFFAVGLMFDKLLLKNKILK